MPLLLSRVSLYLYFVSACLFLYLYCATSLSLRLGDSESNASIFNYLLSGVCVSDCLFGRFHHCSVEIVNGQSSLMLEDAEADPERDAEHAHDE